MAPVCMYVCIHVCMYITLLYTTLHYTSLHYTTLHYIKLHYITLPCESLHYITLHYSTLHYTTHHYTTLHYTTLHYTTCMYGPGRGSRRASPQANSRDHGLVSRLALCLLLPLSPDFPLPSSVTFPATPFLRSHACSVHDVFLYRQSPCVTISPRVHQQDASSAIGMECTTRGHPLPLEAALQCMILAKKGKIMQSRALRPG